MDKMLMVNSLTVDHGLDPDGTQAVGWIRGNYLVFVAEASRAGRTAWTKPIFTAAARFVI
jgi:hypothetical protein